MMLSAVSDEAARKTRGAGSASSGSPAAGSLPMRGRVLVVDDEENLRHMLQLMLRKEGYEVVGAADVQSALVELDQRGFEIVITDLRMPGRGGLELVDEVARRGLRCTVVVMTAYGSRDVAIEAMKRGAYDYLSKPFASDELVLLLRKAEERERLAKENRSLRNRLAEANGSEALPGMVGQSTEMVDLFRTVRKVAEFKTTALIQGESGTGKELVARALHALSPRVSGAFVAINCGAIPSSLLESALFGHRRGAFTDASRDHKGVFEEATGGTLFLDEIADLPLGVQVKLLRVLQESEVRRLGDERDVAVDVRVIAASARDLSQSVAQGRFREDLFYRLNVISLTVPPLRQRRQDIPALAATLMSRLNQRLGLNITTIAPDAFAVLLEAPWPGNVRELENALERAMVLCDGDEITLASLPEYLRPSFAASVASHDGAENDLLLKRAVRQTEAQLIRKALDKTKGNRTRAANLLGLSHRGLLYKLKAYGLGQADESDKDGGPSV